MWTFCVVIDLLHSVSYPFSNFQSRMKYYHVLCWTTACIFGFIVLSLGQPSTNALYNPDCTAKTPHIHDLFLISNDDISSDNGFCWVTSDISSPNPWIFLYIPILLLFSISIFAIYISYRRLRSGIAVSLVHRINILILNFINISCNLAYWIILGLLSLATASIGNKNDTESCLISIILYIVASKGIINLIIWIFVTDINSSLSLSSDNNMTFNDAMREDILYIY